MLKLLLSLFFGSKKVKAEEIQEVKEEPIKKKKEFITLNDVITSSGKYTSRAQSPELTKEVRANIEKLVNLINDLFNDMEYTKDLKVSSGFRPSSVNAGIKNAAKRSAHMIGMAVDLEDVDGSIDALLMKNNELLKKYGLWLEHPDSTKAWAHLDMRDRGKRATNVFKP